LYTAHWPLLVSAGMRLIGAVVVLGVGLQIIGWITRLLQRRFEAAEADDSLQAFLTSLARVGLQILLVISIASLLGMEMTSFIAVLGAAAFAVGLALQGSLANFAGGVLIILFKPFQTGDYIEAAGHAGTVHEVQVFHTIVNTPDNRRVIIPNAALSNSATVNYSANSTRRIDLRFGVGYDDDIDEVKAILQEIVSGHRLILDEPVPQVLLAEHADSAVVFLVRVWCHGGDYWSIHFELMENVKRAFDRAAISIPYPQMDVHLDSANE